jgi:hypothetical protein
VINHRSSNCKQVTAKRIPKITLSELQSPIKNQKTNLHSQWLVEEKDEFFWRSNSHFQSSFYCNTNVAKKDSFELSERRVADRIVDDRESSTTIGRRTLETNDDKQENSCEDLCHSENSNMQQNINVCEIQNKYMLFLSWKGV